MISKLKVFLSFGPLFLVVAMIIYATGLTKGVLIIPAAVVLAIWSIIGMNYLIDRGIL